LKPNCSAAWAMTSLPMRDPVNTSGAICGRRRRLAHRLSSPFKLVAALKVAAGLVVPANNIKDGSFWGQNLPRRLCRSVSKAAAGYLLRPAADTSHHQRRGDAGGILRQHDSTNPVSRRRGGDAAQKSRCGMSAGIFAFSNDKESTRMLLETCARKQFRDPNCSGLWAVQMRLNKIPREEGQWI